MAYISPLLFYELGNSDILDRYCLRTWNVIVTLIFKGRHLSFFVEMFGHFKSIFTSKKLVEVKSTNLYFVRWHFSPLVVFQHYCTYLKSDKSSLNKKKSRYRKWVHYRGRVNDTGSLVYVLLSVYLIQFWAMFSLNRWL